MPKPKPKIKRIKISPTTAETAFVAVKPRLAKLSADSLALVNVDVQVAASAALGVAQMIAQPAIRTRFKNLAKSGEFEASAVKDLAMVARAAWYARHKLLLSEGTRSGAQLPTALVEEANALRARMS